jgi:hypothetical protein
MQNNDQYFQNESSNSKDDQRSNPSPGSKRKKPMPPLIPIKMSAGSSMNLSKSDSDGNQSSGGEEGAESQLHQYKIISSLLAKPELSVESVNKAGSSGTSIDNLANLKKKSSFFDVLRKKLIEGNATGSEDKNLVCKCSYEAKTLSDLIIHQKNCFKQDFNFGSSMFSKNRCQFCNIRFKTSRDLLSHMQKCTVGAQQMIECLDSSSEANGDEKMAMDDDMSDEAVIDNPNERHPMENRVFVWNQLSSKREPSDTNDTSDKNDDSDDNNLVVNEDDDLPETPTLTDSEYMGVESAPGYGEITKKVEPSDDVQNTAMKKVNFI